MPIKNEFQLQDFTRLTQLYDQTPDTNLSSSGSPSRHETEINRSTIERAFIEAFFSRDDSLQDEGLKNRINKFKADAGTLLDMITSGKKGLNHSTLSELQKIALRTMPGAGMLRKPYETTDMTPGINAKSRYCSKPIREGYGLVHIANKQGARHADLFIETASNEGGVWKRHSLVHASFGVQFPRGNPADFNPITEVFRNNKHTANLDVKETIFNANDGNFCTENRSTMDAISYADRQLLGGDHFITLELPVSQIKKMTDYIFSTSHRHHEKAGLPIYQMMEGAISKAELATTINNAQLRLDKITSIEKLNLLARFESITSHINQTEHHDKIRGDLNELKRDILSVSGHEPITIKLKELIEKLLIGVGIMAKPDIEQLISECKDKLQSLRQEQTSMSYYYSAMKAQAQNKIDKIEFKTALDSYVKHTQDFYSYLSNFQETYSERNDGDYEMITTRISAHQLFMNGVSCIPEQIKNDPNYKKHEQSFLNAREAFETLKQDKSDNIKRKADNYLNSSQDRYVEKRQNALVRGAKEDSIGVSTERVRGQWRAASVNCAGLCLRMLSKFSNIKFDGALTPFIGTSSPERLAHSAVPRGFTRPTEDNIPQKALGTNEAKARFYTQP